MTDQQNNEPEPFEIKLKTIEPPPTPPLVKAVPRIDPTSSISGSGIVVGGFLGRAWRGEEDLWRVYWLYGLLYPVLLLLCIQVLTSSTIAGMNGSVLFNILMGLFCFWMCVSLWRCAWNCNWRFWGYWARISSVAYAFNVLNAAIAAVLIVLTGSSVHMAGSSDKKGFKECYTRLESEAKTAGMSVKDYTKTHPELIGDCLHQKLVASKTASLGSSSQTTTTTTVTPVPKSMVSNPSDTCEVKLVAQAIESNLDVKAHVAQNQALLSKCHELPNTPLPTIVRAPTAEPAPVMDACEQKMHDFAVQNKADPKTYIAQNQTYIAQCRAALASQPKQ